MDSTLNQGRNWTVYFTSCTMYMIQCTIHFGGIPNMIVSLYVGLPQLVQPITGERLTHFNMTMILITHLNGLRSFIFVATRGHHCFTNTSSFLFRDLMGQLHVSLCDRSVDAVRLQQLISGYDLLNRVGILRDVVPGVGKLQEDIMDHVVKV